MVVSNFLRTFAPVKPINIFINHKKVTTMLLAFYPVGSEYERHSFDNSTPEEIVNAILTIDNKRIYNISETGYNTKMASLTDLVEDYNDEDLDGGWWSVLIDMTEDEYVNFVTNKD